jgi:peptide/nickel transport system substrate-binding protein
MLKPIGKYTVFFVLSLVIWSCGNSPETVERKQRKGEGNVVYGGLFRMNITDETRSIFPHNMVDASSFNLMKQVYEGLMTINPETKSIEPALAESYSISSDGKTYTFQIRKGVYFHDDQIFDDGKGREVKAQDIAFCYTKLCEPSPYNQLYAFVVDVVKGAREHYESGGKTGVSGIRVIDDYTLEIELEHPTPTFLSILTHPCSWIFPKELYEYGEDINSWSIGTGPFKARTIKINDVVIFERNKAYWGVDEYGNSLPYLDAIRCNFETNVRRQLNLFLDGKLDLIMTVPFESVPALKNAENSNQSDLDFKIVNIPGLRVEYYGFQHRSEIFSDIKVRKAINYAIDREFIVDSILYGYGTPATHGFVPPSMPAYDADSVNGFSYDPEKARELLNEAGFESGNDFPVLTLQLNDGNQTVIEVAEAVQRMLIQNLGITVELSVLPRDTHYEQIEQGNVNFWRDGWIADYPDPENFLKLFHGKLVPDDTQKSSYLNSVRFKNTNFDNYFEASMRETAAKKRMRIARRADQILIEEAAVAPLYFEEWIWLLKNDVKNLSVGSMGVLELKSVYLDESKKLPDSEGDS